MVLYKSPVYVCTYVNGFGVGTSKEEEVVEPFLKLDAHPLKETWESHVTYIFH